MFKKKQGFHIAAISWSFSFGGSPMGYESDSEVVNAETE
jgi:hypothetical protein